MITVLKSAERGKTEFDWLESWHSFSFGEYWDPSRMGFRALRVLNDDTVAPGKGFPMHGHRDMEIVSYVAKGAMEHKDSIGNGSTIRPGEIQRMSAGAGMQHGEWNASQTEPLHLIQIWLLPIEKGGTPSYEQAAYDEAEMRAGWVVLAAPDGGAVKINSNAVVAGTIVKAGDKRSLEFDPDRAGYLFVVRGAISFHGNELYAGDAAQIENEPSLEFEALTETEILGFDLG